MSYTIDQTHFPSTQIHLNSKYADAYGGVKSAKSWCYFIFKEPIVKLPNAYDFLISLTSMECPCSTYCINSTNNTVIFQYSDGDGNFDFVYTIPVGNYSAADICALPPIANFYVSVKVSGYNDLQNKFTFNLTPLNGQVLGPFIKNSNTCIFGLSGKTIYGTQLPDFSWSFTSDSCVDLSGSRAIFFKIMNVHTQSYDSRTKYSGSILARIPMSQEQLGIVFWSNYASFKSKCSLKNITSLEIQIVDEDGILVDFNSIDWTATITLDIIGQSSMYLPDVATFK